MNFSIQLEDFFSDIEEDINITRIELERVCNPLFQRIQQLTEDAVREAALVPSDINEVLLIGGSSRIPAIRKMLEQTFQRCTLTDWLHADEAVAYGATIKAAQLVRSGCNEIPTTRVVELTPLSLGVEICGNRFSVIVPRNTWIPVNIEKTYCTVANDQESIQFKV